jgi:hypothetical protein
MRPGKRPAAVFRDDENEDCAASTFGFLHKKSEDTEDKRKNACKLLIFKCFSVLSRTEDKSKKGEDTEDKSVR